MDIGKDLQTAYDEGYKDGVKYAQRWIPVSERLPKEKGGYLVTGGIFKQVFVYIAHWNGSFWDVEDTVWAWMPLPEPFTDES